MKLSIIIPCFNEVKTIEKIIDKIIGLNDLNKEIIVIDDYSTDGTRKILQEKLINEVDKLILNERIKAQKEYNITSTPTIYINDKKYKGEHKYKPFKKTIEKLL